MYSEDSEDDLQVAAPENGTGESAMMSLFSSYYDIPEEGEKEEIPTPSYKSAAELIDSAQFDAAIYVKEVLETSSIEDLVSKDIKMVQEIKSIDSDLQMLVYENYAKFISATDTIKRMKTNVEAMDTDMSSVLEKMDSISQSSAILDSILETSRSEVDKYVRVKRLLERLQFLSVLPECLAKMIHQEEYKEAVELYNKTISILKNHTDILSFKNIQQRTELMMHDLRSRVMNFLDNPALESSKLTHYVTVLRLMDAPRDQIMNKFIAAHTSRATALNADLHAYLQGNKHASISSVLKFHQNIILGLIESTKGLSELFHGGDHVLQAQSSLLALLRMIQAVREVYTVSAGRALREFFERYKANLVEAVGTAADATTGAGVTEESSTSNPFEDVSVAVEEQQRDAQLKSYEFDEERQQWLTFARQSILDWQYLETALGECVRAAFPAACRDSTVSDTEVASIRSSLRGSIVISTPFSRHVLEVLDEHRASVMAIYTQQFMDTFTEYTDRLTTLCNIRSLVEEGGADVTLRSIIAKHSVESKERLEAVAKSFFTAFSDICSCAKLVYEVVHVTRASADDASSIVDDFLDTIIARFTTLNALAPNTSNLSTLKDIYDEPAYTEQYQAKPATITWSRELTAPLASALLLKKVSASLIRSVSVVLIEQDMAGDFNSDNAKQSLCTKKLNDASYRCLIRCIETHAFSLSHTLRLALFNGVTAANQGAKKAAVFPDVVNFALALDVFAVACCIILAEAPAPLKAFTVERDLHKRSATRKGQGKRGVQQDIDRLFASKVEVFEADQMVLGVDSIFRVVIKALLKAAVETCRDMVLSVEAHYQVQADVLFVRQVAGCILLSDSFGEVEDLGEQTLNASDLRCLDPDEIPEGRSLLKTVSDALSAISNQPTLFQR